MTTNDLYQQALVSIKTSAYGHGNAKHTLADGSLLICAVCPVAGRSVTKLHYRTTWHYKTATERYSKQISQVKAQSLLNV